MHPAIEWEPDLDRFRWRFIPVGSSSPDLPQIAAESAVAALGYITANVSVEQIFSVDHDVDASWQADGFGTSFNAALARTKRDDARHWFEAGVGGGGLAALPLDQSRRLGIESYRLNPNDLAVIIDWAEQALRLDERGRAYQEALDALARLETARRRILQLGANRASLAWIAKAYGAVTTGHPSDIARVRTIAHALGLHTGPASSLIMALDEWDRSWTSWGETLTRQPSLLELAAGAVRDVRGLTLLAPERWYPYVVAVAQSGVKTLSLIASSIPRCSDIQDQLHAAIEPLHITATVGTEPRLAEASIAMLGLIAEPAAVAALSAIGGRMPAFRAQVEAAVASARRLIRERGAAWPR